MDGNNEDNNAPEFRGRCEDAPCCGCCGADQFEQYDPEMDEMHDLEPEFESDEPEDGMTDVEADADALASAGWGTDEDYGGEDSFLDSYWESQTECDMF